MRNVIQLKLSWSKNIPQTLRMHTPKFNIQKLSTTYKISAAQFNIKLTDIYLSN